MKFLFALALLVAAAVAAPPVGGADKDAVVIKNELNNIGVEGYDAAYETSNGISAQEQGVVKNPGSENEALEVRGQYAYTGPDGVLYQLSYLANEGGFQPSAAHIPA